MTIYNLVEYDNNYSKPSGSLWQYYRDEPLLDANDTITDFSAANNSHALFKLKQKITGSTAASGTKDVSNNGANKLFK